MSHLIPQLIIVGLGASVSPIAVMVLIAVMAHKNACKNSLSFILGYTATLIAIGIAGVSIFHASSTKASKTHGYVDLILGIICFALIIYNIRKKSDKKEIKKIKDDINPLKAITLGSICMFSNPSTYVIYISGLHTIGAAKLKVTDSLLSLAILTLITLVTLIAPVLTYFTFPQKSEKMLDSLREWLLQHKKIIGLAVLVLIGSYLSMKGISTIFFG